MQRQTPDSPPREDAFAALYRDLGGRVYNLVLRSVHDKTLSEDICQEVWLKVHRRMDSIRDPEALRAWVFRTAVHACIDFSRSRAGRQRAATASITESVPDLAPEPEDAALDRVELNLAWEALASLSPRQSAAIYLRQIEGYSYRQIASVLRCSDSAVESLLFRARQTFAGVYEQLESGQAERCRMMRRVMAAVLDNEGTRLQQEVAQAHLRDCATCRAYVHSLRKGSTAYAGLPLVTAAGQVVVSTAASGGGPAALIAELARNFVPLIVQGKALAIAGAFTGALATAGAASAVAGFTPRPAAIVTEIVDLASEEEPPPAVARPDAGGPHPGAVAARPTATPTPAPAAPAAGDDAAEPAPMGTAEPPPSPPAGPLLEPPALPSPTPEGPVQQLLQEPLETVTDLLQDPVGTLGETIENTVETVNQVIEGVTGVVDQTVGGTTETVNQTVGETTEAVNQTVGGTTEAVSQTVGGTTETINDTLEDAGVPLEISTIELPDLGLPPLLGGGSTPEPEPSSTPGSGGLLGGLLN